MIHRKNNDNKLIFYYGTMSSGKTTDLLNLWYSKKEDGFYPVLLKPSSDVKGNDRVVTRGNSSVPVDFLINHDDDIYLKISEYILENILDIIIVDEVQFLTYDQINQLSDIVDNYGIDVVCYGLLTDFKGNMFDASKRLMEISDEKIEVERQCSCGRKRIFNARFLNGEIVLKGDQFGIDGEIPEEYHSVCRQCYKNFVKIRNVREKK